MNDDRLTPEERAVIAAALALHDARGSEIPQREIMLLEAITAYRRATAPPEPFEAYLRWTGEEWEKDGGQNWPMVSTDPDEWFKNADGVYRCTVTPIERVR